MASKVKVCVVRVMESFYFFFVQKKFVFFPLCVCGGLRVGCRPLFNQTATNDMKTPGGEGNLDGNDDWHFPSLEQNEALDDDDQD